VHVHRETRDLLAATARHVRDGARNSHRAITSARNADQLGVRAGQHQARGGTRLDLESRIADRTSGHQHDGEQELVY
jgi:hypothetical protein